MDHPVTPMKRLAQARPSIRTKLLAAINIVLLGGLVVVTLIDYQRGLSERLYDKQIALGEEASLLLSAVQTLRHHGPADVQAYIDRSCAQMRDTTSPGHHIAAVLDGTTLQARVHHRASPAFAQAMRRAAAAADHQSQVEGQAILVGVRGDGDITIYVSEFITDIRHAAHTQLLARAAGIALVGLAVEAIVNFVLLRLVTRPIQSLAGTVRRIGTGEFGTTPFRFTTRELDFLSTEIAQMSRLLADADRHRRQQMNKARQIQMHLLPRADHLQTLGIRHVHLPAEDVGGDFFDVKMLDEDQLIVCLGDVTGHGVPAAMGAGMLKMLFQHTQSDPRNPASVLADINRRFHAATLDGDFATMMIALIDRRRGCLIYAGAGHETAYLLHAADAGPPAGRVRELKATGMLLGVEPDVQYDVIRIPIHPGDTILMLTDGLAETASSDGRLLGRHAILETLSAGESAASIHDIAQALIQRADAHRADQPQQDDITIVTIRV
ncbi:MAG: PP2C family protein-serine/threonine phosphatase [Phycisphaerales bacterium]